MDKLRETRLNGLESTILYYEELCNRGHELSEVQREQLSDASRNVSVFGEYGNFLHEIAEELLGN